MEKEENPKVDWLNETFVKVYNKQKVLLLKFIMAQNPEKQKKSVVLLQADPLSINRSPLNSSSAKMQYSMPRAQRFSQMKPNQGKFYQIPDTKSSRSASLGFGNKMEFGKQPFQKPPPGQYYLKSDFESDKKKGITISAGRQVIKNNSAFLINTSIPGPGQYNPKNPLLQQRSYSLSSKVIDLSDKWTKLIPGPGTYQTLQLLDKNLKTNNSRVQNVRSAKFNKQKRESQFEGKVKQNIPGPGQYQKINNAQLSSKFMNNHGFKFSHGERQGIVDKAKTKNPIPGPGAYKNFSEFLH